MVPRSLFPILALSMVIHSTGCNSEQQESTDSRHALNENDLSAFRPISHRIARASSLTLYEGLPNPVWETDLYQRELETKKCVKLHDYPFFERTLDVSQSDREELRRLCVTPETYFTFIGEKSCGGFHPDYCLRWIDGETAYELLICFTCEEMKFYGPMQYLQADLRGDPYKRFKAVLGKYQDQRPAAK
jgi:hypothetical protein